MGFLDNLVNGGRTLMDKFIPLKAYNSKIALLNGTEIDEVEIILNKKSSDFSYGKFVILNLEDEEITPSEEQKKILQLLNNGNDLQGRTKFLYLYKYYQHKYGIAFIYFKGADFMTIPDSYLVVDNEAVMVEYSSKSMFEIETPSDLIKSVNVTGVSNVDVENFLPVLDLGFNFTSRTPNVRSKKIPNKIALLYNSNQAIIHAMNKVQLMILTPDNGNNPMSNVARSIAPPSTDNQILEQKEKFQEDFSIEHGSVTYLNKSYKVIDTNPDVGRMKAFESLKHGFETVSLMYGIDPRVVNNQTKYDDMELVLKQYVATIEQEGKELGESLSNYFKTERFGFKIGMDYSELRDLLLKEEAPKEEAPKKESEERLDSDLDLEIVKDNED